MKVLKMTLIIVMLLGMNIAAIGIEAVQTVEPEVILGTFENKTDNDLIIYHVKKEIARIPAHQSEDLNKRIHLSKSMSEMVSFDFFLNLYTKDATNATLAWINIVYKFPYLSVTIHDEDKTIVDQKSLSVSENRSFLGTIIDIVFDGSRMKHSKIDLIGPAH